MPDIVGSILAWATVTTAFPGMPFPQHLFTAAPHRWACIGSDFSNDVHMLLWAAATIMHGMAPIGSEAPRFGQDREDLFHHMFPLPEKNLFVRHIPHSLSFFITDPHAVRQGMTYSNTTITQQMCIDTCNALNNIHHSESLDSIQSSLYI